MESLRRWSWGSVLLLVLALAGRASPVFARSDDEPQRTLRMGVSSYGGDAYAMASALCGLLNRKLDEDDAITCVLEATGGSGATLRALAAGRIDLGLAEAGVFQQMVRGGAGQLKALVAVYSQYLQIVVGRDSGIESLDDLIGRSFNTAPPPDGDYGLFSDLWRTAGLDWSDIGIVSQDVSHSVVARFCKGDVDAVGFSSDLGHPLLTELFRTCPARMLPLPNGVRQRLTQDEPFVRRADIPAGTYPGLTAAVPTVALDKILVTTTALPPGLVRRILHDIINYRRTIGQDKPDLLSTLRLLSIPGAGGGLVHPAVDDVMKDEGVTAPRR